MIGRSALKTLRSNALPAFTRYYSEGAQSSTGSSRPSTPQVAEVPGLSSAVVMPATGPVGPDVDPQKAGAYKVPEYFCYNNMSYFEAEIEMSKFRLPQPSALKK